MPEQFFLVALPFLSPHSILHFIFENIENVVAYFDAILIVAESKEGHDKTPEKVYQRTRALNVKFNKAHVQYRHSEVKYSGIAVNVNYLRLFFEEHHDIKDLLLKKYELQNY